MTRKHFQLIAGVLREVGASTELGDAMADALATTNPNFDRKRFERASLVWYDKCLNNLEASRPLPTSEDWGPSGAPHWTMPVIK